MIHSLEKSKETLWGVIPTPLHVTQQLNKVCISSDQTNRTISKWLQESLKHRCCLKRRFHCVSCTHSSICGNHRNSCSHSCRRPAACDGSQHTNLVFSFYFMNSLEEIAKGQVISTCKTDSNGSRQTKCTGKSVTFKTGLSSGWGWGGVARVMVVEGFKILTRPHH